MKIAESLLQDCTSVLFLSRPLELNVLPQDLKEGVGNYCIPRDPYSIVCVTPQKCPAPGMALAPRPIPHLVDLSHMRPPSCFWTDKCNYFYPFPASVRFHSRNGGSSCLHIAKYVMKVLEVFQNKLSNSRKPLHLHISISTLWTFHTNIIEQYFNDWSQASR